MRGAIARFAAPAVVALAAGGGGADGAPEAGEAIFSGRAAAGAMALVGGVETLAARFPCRNCHGRDGEGGAEGDAPSILWADLTRATADRPAYDRARFAAALRDGRAADGRALSRIMPRYRLDENGVESLIRHLDALPALQRAGISGDEIVFGVPLGREDGPLPGAYLDALEGAFVDLTAPAGVFGRRVRVVALRGGTGEIVATARREICAVVAPANGDLAEALEEAGVPVFFPLRPIGGAKAGGLRLALLDDWGLLAGRLADRVAADEAVRPVLYLGDAPESFRRDVERRLGALSVADLNAEEVEKLTPGALSGRTVYGLASGAGRHVAALKLAGARTVLLVENERIVRLAARDSTTPIEAHARFAAGLLVEGLVRAGRDVTRARLFESVGDAMGAAGFGDARAGARDFLVVE